MTTPRIAAIIVSTRPNRKGPAIGAWVSEQLADRTDLDVSLVDLVLDGTLQPPPGADATPQHLADALIHRVGASRLLRIA